MIDFSGLFQRQAEWQRSLRHLPWPEKLRMAARLRESVMKLRRLKTSTPDDADAAREHLKQDPNTDR